MLMDSFGFERKKWVGRKVQHQMETYTRSCRHIGDWLGMKRDFFSGVSECIKLCVNEWNEREKNQLVILWAGKKLWIFPVTHLSIGRKLRRD